MSAPPKNKNALKGPEPASCWLQVRVTPRDKRKWVRAARPKKLSEWVVERLNGATETKESPTAVSQAKRP